MKNNQAGERVRDDIRSPIDSLLRKKFWLRLCAASVQWRLKQARQPPAVVRRREEGPDSTEQGDG
jgi:hypothetical protein